MRTRTPPLALLLAAAILALAVAAPARAATLFAVTTTNQIVQFDSATPGNISSPRNITGLQAGEDIVGIDFRPSNGLLYGLGTSNRVYTINTANGAATPVATTPFTPALAGSDFGIDFNPVADRLRVVSDADQNLRLNPNTGATEGSTSPLAYATGDPNSGQNPNVTSTAYSNNFLGATSTTLYGRDSGRDVLVMQNPPDAGTLHTVGAFGVDFNSLGGFDILDDGTAFAASAGMGASTLYTIDLATGAATFAGTVPAPLRALAGFPTAASGPFGGLLVRPGAADDRIQIQLSNDGMRPAQFLRVELLPGYTVTDPMIVSGPSAPVNPIPSGVAAGPFAAPDYWSGGGTDLVIDAHVNPRYPDNGGANLFVCPPPCFGVDDGPFPFGGPAPIVTPGGDGTGGTGGTTGGGTGLKGDFDLNGVVDLSDLATLLNAPLSEDGKTIRIETPDGVIEGDQMVILADLLANFGRVSAAQRRRSQLTVIARRRATLTAPQRKRIRLPLTKAGRRLYRGYDRKRIRVVLRLKVTYRPASGAAVQRRTFRKPLRLRVVKPTPRR